jgi:hypothetical protein
VARVRTHRWLPVRGWLMRAARAGPAATRRARAQPPGQSPGLWERCGSWLLEGMAPSKVVSSQGIPRCWTASESPEGGDADHLGGRENGGALHVSRRRYESSFSEPWWSHEPTGETGAWKTLPSWFLVSTQDRMINPDAAVHGRSHRRDHRGGPLQPRLPGLPPRGGGQADPGGSPGRRSGLGRRERKPARTQPSGRPQ